MMLPVLRDIVIILGLSVLIILLFHRFRIPSILGFLITGIIIGPFGLTLINASHQVEVFAEIGVVFLMFLIGIEFSIKGLMAIKKTVIWGGLIQVGVTIIVICYLGMIFGPLNFFTEFTQLMTQTTNSAQRMFEIIDAIRRKLVFFPIPISSLHQQFFH